MLKLNHCPSRRHAGALLATALAGSGLLLALPAVAQDQPSADAPKTERIEVRRIVKDGKVIDESNIPADVRAQMENCAGEKFDFVSGTATDKKRSVVKLCAKPGSSKAEVAKMLEGALARLESSPDMSADTKAELVSRLKARIAELRAGG